MMELKRFSTDLHLKLGPGSTDNSVRRIRSSNFNKKGKNLKFARNFQPILIFRMFIGK